MDRKDVASCYSCTLLLGNIPMKLFDADTLTQTAWAEQTFFEAMGLQPICYDIGRSWIKDGGLPWYLPYPQRNSNYAPVQALEDARPRFSKVTQVTMTRQEKNAGDAVVLLTDMFE